MKFIYCLAILLCPYVSKAQLSFAQVGIGEALPPFEAANVLNHTSASINMKELKGKLVLLDFMLTTCPSCLHSLQQYDSLGTQFNDQVKVIAVTVQPTATVKAFLNKSPVGKKLRLPFITADTKLKAMFPYDFVSHMVWIDKAGKVKAITGGEYVTRENIQLVLDGQPVNWPVKADAADFDFKEYFMNRSSQLEERKAVGIFSSSFFEYLPGVLPSLAVKPDSTIRMVRYLLSNMTAPQMLTRLYRKFSFPNSRIILNTADSNHYQFDGKGMREEWNQENLFCYEAFAPFGLSEEQRRQKIMDDLCLRFGVTAFFQTQEVNCLLLKKGNKPLQSQPKTEDNISVWEAIEALNNRFNGPAVVDSAGDTQLIYLPLGKTDLANLPLLTNAIRRAGYLLLPVKLPMELLFINDRINQPN